MEDVSVDDEREHLWRMVLDNNEVGRDGEKALIHARRWYIYHIWKLTGN